MKDRATIKDLAAKAGVSVGTVSNILNGKFNFADETRKRVWDAAEALSYSPNQEAKKLRAGGMTGRLKTNIIMHISHMGYETPVNEALERLNLTLLSWEAQKRGLFLMQYWYHTEQGFACPPILNGYIDGVIAGTPHEKVVEHVKSKLPVVLMDVPFPPETLAVPMVNQNCRKGILEMMRILKNYGHTDIGVCYSTSPIESQRYGAVVEAAARSGVHVHQDFHTAMEIDPETHDKVIREFAAFAMAHVRRKEITALVCLNDYYTLCLYDIFKDKGLRIPGDLSLTGYGRSAPDIPASPVSAVIYDWPGMVRSAVSLLKDLIDGTTAPQSTELLVNPTFFHGETIGKAIL